MAGAAAGGGGGIGGPAAALDRRTLPRRIARRLVLGTMLANGAGAVVAFLYLSVVFPEPERADAIINDERAAVLLVVFLIGGMTVSTLVGLRLTRAARAWLPSGRPAGEAEREAILGLPRRLVALSAVEWAFAALVFSALNLDYSLERAVEVAVTLVLGGLVSCAAAWLLTERELRPAVALVLTGSDPGRTRALGIAPRVLLTWALCSGIPLVGLALIPVGEDVPARDLVAPIVFVAAVALVSGAVLMTLVMRSVADPVGEVRRAMEVVAEGRTDVRVAVDDASEVGRLQAGFNAMVEGLAERERLRDLFGRQVGLDVAREALERGTSLGGTEQTVGALFVDVIGSTALAAREAPERVVGLLNELFAVVVSTVERHGGSVNKFEGDAALCVFGAPVPAADVADRALATARDLAGRLRREATLDAAIGVSCGTAVAGHLGAESRFEYTVIGDPVNEASRLTELAKTRPERVVASAATVRRASPSEAARWRVEGEALLRGRPEPTELAVPA